MRNNRPYKRTDRISKQILEILCEILIRHIDLNYLGFVTFTSVQISPDLRNARVCYSILNPSKSWQQINDEINNHRKAFKKFMGPKLRLKYIPDLRFYHDERMEYGDRISKLFRDLELGDHDTEHR